MVFLPRPWFVLTYILWCQVLQLQHFHFSFIEVLLWEEVENERKFEADSCSLKSLRMDQRISAHLFIVGLLCLRGAKHCKASSRIFSSAKVFAVVWSSLGSKTEIASPSMNLFIACTCSIQVTLKNVCVCVKSIIKNLFNKFITWNLLFHLWNFLK